MVSPMAAMIIHGTQDNTVPLSTGEYSREYWLASNGCPGAPSSPTNPAPCVAYDGCTEPVLWCQHGGGHPWPAFAGTAVREWFLSL
jgi:polyhydroxybutyrate depolymerase